MTKNLAPTRTDVEIGTYALVIHEGGQDLYQYEKPLDWEDPEWIEKRQYAHADVPPLSLEQTQIKQQTNDDELQWVTVYASELNADTQRKRIESRGDPSPNNQSYRGHVIRFSDGQMIPDENETIHTTQEQNMGAAIDYLVRERDLIDEIDIPHLPSWARQNCSINSEESHPNGGEMRGAYELTGGYYLYTSLNKKSKKDRIEDLAGRVDLDPEFLGKW